MPKTKAIRELKGRIRTLCTLLRTAEILEALGHTDLASKILDIMEEHLQGIPTPSQTSRPRCCPRGGDTA